MTTQAPAADRVRAAWEDLADGFDEHVSPLTITFGEQVLDRLDVRPGTRFLDVAAGSGALALRAARRGARVVAVDIAPTMVERLVARARAEGLGELEGLVMDGEHLELEDGAFDVTASLNGVSLFPDFATGLAEMVRVTSRGGLVAVVCFGGGVPQAEFVSFFLSAVRTAVPGAPLPPPEPPPLPFQLADPDRLRRALVDAGLRDVQVAQVTWTATVRDGRHYWDAVTASNPIASRLAADLTGPQRADVLAVLDGMLRERSGGAASAPLHSRMNLGTGTKGEPS